MTVRTDLVTAVRDGEVVLRDETLRFDACVIATGATPKRPFPEAMVLRSLADARALRDAANGSATVIGSGFIGCEAAASLAMRGLQTSRSPPTRTSRTRRGSAKRPGGASWAGSRSSA